MPNSSDGTRQSAGRVVPGTVRIHRFPWDELPSFGADQIDRANRLARLLPGRDDERALRAVADELEALTGLEHHLEFRELRMWDDRTDLPELGDAFRTKFHLPPHPELGVVAVDMELVDAWLGALLDAPPEVRKLGEVDDREFGLATFVLLSVLKQLRSRGAPPVVLPTDPPLEEVLGDRLRDADTLIELTFAARALGETHLARVLVPDALLHHMEVFAEGGSQSRESAARLRSGPMSDLELSFPVAVGHTRLRREVAQHLERGDVVLFDEDGWSGTDDASEEAATSATPGARLHLRPSSCDRSLAGHLRARPNCWAFEIADLQLRTHDDTMTEPESEASEASTESDPDDDASPEATELLESPEVVLEVRIGSAQLTLRELGELGAGQVLELDRGVGDRADLIVEGQTVGSGELVDVEGRLGVRIEKIEN